MDSDRGGVGGPRSRRGAKRDVKFVEVGSGGRYQYARRVGTRFDSDASQGALARSVEMVGPSRSVEPARADMRRARVRAVGYAPRRRPRKPCCISDDTPLLRPSLLFWRQRRFRLDKYLRKVHGSTSMVKRDDRAFLPGARERVRSSPPHPFGSLARRRHVERVSASARR